MGCVVSESISAQNQKKSVTDGRTDGQTDKSKLYPFASRGIIKYKHQMGEMLGILETGVTQTAFTGTAAEARLNMAHLQHK